MRDVLKSSIEVVDVRRDVLQQEAVLLRAGSVAFVEPVEEWLAPWGFYLQDVVVCDDGVRKQLDESEGRDLMDGARRVRLVRVLSGPVGVTRQRVWEKQLSGKQVVIVRNFTETLWSRPGTDYASLLLVPRWPGC